MNEQRERDIKQLGQCLKLTRQMHGRTQADLGKILSISPQQVQKYELGLNRMPADVVLRLARELEVSVTAFYPSDASKALHGLQLADDCLGVLKKLTSLDAKQKSLVVDLVDQLANSRLTTRSVERSIEHTDVG